MDNLTLKIKQLKKVTNSALETLNDFKTAYDQSRLIKEQGERKKLKVDSRKLKV